MKRIIGAVFLAAITGHAAAQAGGAAQGAQPVTSAPSTAEKLGAVVLTGVVAAIIANHTASSH
ncbi:MAG TPA: hypothetical protein VK572_00625 [Burkholderiales bacterium]|nr:hypothetical protein [Burkholderiales bacterium]